MKELTKIKKKRIKTLNLIKTHHYENLTLQDILAKMKAVPKKKTEINDRKRIKKQTKIKKRQRGLTIQPTKHPCHDRKPYTKKDEIPTKKRGQLIKEIKTAKKQHQQPKLTIYENSALQNVLAAVPKKEK